MTAPADTRLHRPDAIAIARRFVELIEDCCVTLVVAGSLRRRLAYVNDIEVVAVPQIEPQVDGLFPEITVDVDRLDQRMLALLDSGQVAQRLDRNGVARWGPTAKLVTFPSASSGQAGAKIDLFSPREAGRFGWILVLRTGPAAYSRQLVVPRGQLTKDKRPGLLPPEIVPRDGWLTERASGYRIPTPTERDAFEALRLPYVEPWERL